MTPQEEYSLQNPNASMLDDTDPETNLDYTRRDQGGMVNTNNGLADRLLSNNNLYRSMKGDWLREGWNKAGNILTTTGREDGKFYVRREQMNTEAIADRCRRYRSAAEQGVPDPMAPLDDSGGLAWKWMDLPNVIEQRISDDYFGGMRWSTIKRDRTLKAQFYKVVEQEYNQYVCYPGGKLPIPIDVPYPTKRGQQRFFQGN
ncbi:hypothetical protein UFOVP94_44 [uncultured Caudovirales phage]|uniref:Uncharacterized protein n=1 Tax=uncultured Caudovirales phage TaxID=2100421 RepID=A0A6J7WF49_9CAUD|nr:hypothetical protein UFOVP94_44 [uncultured Caudovirales phage]CAB5212687.1 hypothetical protein UFOVP186_43 [uncultured Caudovirales phage]